MPDDKMQKLTSLLDGKVDDDVREKILAKVKNYMGGDAGAEGGDAPAAPAATPDAMPPQLAAALAKKKAAQAAAPQEEVAPEEETEDADEVAAPEDVSPEEGETVNIPGKKPFTPNVAKKPVADAANGVPAKVDEEPPAEPTVQKPGMTVDDMEGKIKELLAKLKNLTKLVAREDDTGKDGGFHLADFSEDEDEAEGGDGDGKKMPDWLKKKFEERAAQRKQEAGAPAEEEAEDADDEEGEEDGGDGDMTVKGVRIDAIPESVVKKAKDEIGGAEEEAEEGAEEEAEDADDAEEEMGEDKQHACDALFKAAIAEVDARNALYNAVTPFSGRFDCSQMTRNQVARKACKILGMACDSDDVALAKLEGFLAGRKVDMPKSIAMDGFKATGKTEAKKKVHFAMDASEKQSKGELSSRLQKYLGGK